MYASSTLVYEDLQLKIIDCWSNDSPMGKEWMNNFFSLLRSESESEYSPLLAYETCSTENLSVKWGNTHSLKWTTCDLQAACFLDISFAIAKNNFWFTIGHQAVVDVWSIEGVNHAWHREVYNPVHSSGNWQIFHLFTFFVLSTILRINPKSSTPVTYLEPFTIMLQCFHPSI